MLNRKEIAKQLLNGVSVTDTNLNQDYQNKVSSLQDTLAKLREINRKHYSDQSTQSSFLTKPETKKNSLQETPEMRTQSSKSMSHSNTATQLESYAQMDFFNHLKVKVGLAIHQPISEYKHHQSMDKLIEGIHDNIKKSVSLFVKNSVNKKRILEAEKAEQYHQEILNTFKLASQAEIIEKVISNVSYLAMAPLIVADLKKEAVMKEFKIDLYRGLMAGILA